MKRTLVAAHLILLVTPASAFDPTPRAQERSVARAAGRDLASRITATIRSN